MIKLGIIKLKINNANSNLQSFIKKKKVTCNLSLSMFSFKTQNKAVFLPSTKLVSST